VHDGESDADTSVRRLLAWLLSVAINVAEWIWVGL
jgi:hypothetical protein